MVGSASGFQVASCLPIEAPDGAIWWTGMWASLVGRLDPVIFTRLPSAAPHSITQAPDSIQSGQQRQTDAHAQTTTLGITGLDLAAMPANGCRRDGEADAVAAAGAVA